MAIDDNTALLFLHIPKTAGTSLVAALDQLYSPDERLHLYDHQPDSILPRDFWKLSVQERGRLRFVAGHFLYGLHEGLPRPSRYITVVREPVERLLSLYHHHQTIPGSAYYERIRDEQLSFEDFVMDNRIEQTDNDQVRFLSGIRRAIGRCDEAMLDAARDHIDGHFAAVLVQDDLERGMRVLGNAIGADLPALEHRNVSRERTANVSLPPGTVRRIEERIWLDARLYEYARASLANRLS